MSDSRTDYDQGYETFMSFAQHRVVTGSRAIAHAEELRGLIDLHGAWGWTWAEFQEKAGVRFDGDTAHVTELYWAGDAGTLEEVWERVQGAGRG
ncbi:hypothetical protein [Deinococcus sp. QL22]|uniref:hypothetical protein n=1 Tax=Deinococcus sp. QL22 TaxID=2939437 RepID=UPI002016FC48|nr:hypothetical protein [Deinococcus sp. QL22]UQN06833.1 hypothetical protein M1R55_02605 [Deinococcus sp. QL22]